MADSTSSAPTLADAAALVASSENAAIQSIFDKTKAYVADIQAILDSLDYPPQFQVSSNARRIASDIVANLSFRTQSELPQLLSSYASAMTPPTPAPATTGSAN